MLNKELLLTKKKDKWKSDDVIHFIAACDGDNINFFRLSGSSIPPSSDFNVYINGKLINQEYTNLTFKENDEIIIELNNKNSYYPYFNPGLSSIYDVLDYIREIVEPFPSFYTNHSNPTMENNLSGMFNNCSKLIKICDDLFINNHIDNVYYYFESTFRNCISLEAIPNDLLKKYASYINSVAEMFYNCLGLTTIPQNLFKYNTGLTLIRSCFEKCVNLKNFKLYIGSSSVIYLNKFIPDNSGGTVIVPKNSNTYRNFLSTNISGLTIETF